MKLRQAVSSNYEGRKRGKYKIRPVNSTNN
jgi:hypothetical protein